MELIVFPLAELTTVSLLTEAIVQVVKASVAKEFSEQGKQVLSTSISVVLCMALQIGIFSVSQNPDFVVQYMGYVCAGLICSRGANFVHDLISKVGSIAKSKK